MAFDITTFSNSLNQNGVLPDNRFVVSFTSPGALRSSLSNVSQVDKLIQVRAEQVNVPGVALSTQDIHPYGMGIKRKHATNVDFTQNSITFLDDKNNTLYKYFYIWMNSIFDFTGVVNNGQINSVPSYRVDYKKNSDGTNNTVTNIFVNIYDYTNGLVTSAVMENAFPTSVNDISLDWNRNNNHFKLVVGFSFDRWYIQNVSSISSFSAPISQNYQSLPLFTYSQTPIQQLKQTATISSTNGLAPTINGMVVNTGP
jgi:hypothetical protein